MTKESKLYIYHFYPKSAVQTDREHAGRGVTVVYDSDKKVFAVSRCAAPDNFSRKRGISICMNRIKTAPSSSSPGEDSHRNHVFAGQSLGLHSGLCYDSKAEMRGEIRAVARLLAETIERRAEELLIETMEQKAKELWAEAAYRRSAGSSLLRHMRDFEHAHVANDDIKDRFMVACNR